MNLSQLVDSFLKARSMSRAELCTLLGYKSKTSLVRVLNGKTRLSTLLQFEAVLTKKLALAAEEAAALRDRVIDIRHGEEYLKTTQQIEILLKGGLTCTDASVTLMPEDGPVSLSDYCASKKEPEISVINWLHAETIGAIRSLLERGMTVSHYIYAMEKSSAMIHAINRILPVFHYPGYACYFVSLENTAPSLRMDDALILRYTGDDGSFHYELILLKTPTEGIAMQASGTIESLRPVPERCVSLKSTNEGRIDSLADFLRLLARNEESNTIFDFKPDPCIALTPTDILFAAFNESGFPELLGQDALPELYELSRIREKNYREKREPTYCFMKRSALRAFVETGRLSDHLAGLRPFTPKERAGFLKRLLELHRGNPHFHICIPEDEDMLKSLNICCYYGRGLYITGMDNHYLNDEGSEIRLMPPAKFYELFEEYCKNEIAARCSKTYTTETLSELILRCEELSRS